MVKARDVQSTTDQANTYRVRKSRSRRRYRRSRRYFISLEVSTNSKKEDRSIVFFLHHKEDTRFFLILAARFSIVQIKYFK